MKNVLDAVWEVSAELTDAVIERQKKIYEMSELDEPESDDDFERVDEECAELTERVADRMMAIVQEAVEERLKSALKGSVN